MSQSQNEPTKLADVLGGPRVVAQGRMILELVAIAGGPYWLMYASESIALKVGFGLRCARQLAVQEFLDELQGGDDAERN
jgi:hypothetical protein